MVFAVPVEGGEHDGEDGGGVVADQAHDVPGDDVLYAHITKAVYPIAVEIELTHYSSSRALSLPLGNADC